MDMVVVTGSETTLEAYFVEPNGEGVSQVRLKENFLNARVMRQPRDCRSRAYGFNLKIGPEGLQPLQIPSQRPPLVGA